MQDDHKVVCNLNINFSNYNNNHDILLRCVIYLRLDGVISTRVFCGDVRDVVWGETKKVIH